MFLVGLSADYAMLILCGTFTLSGWMSLQCHFPGVSIFCYFRFCVEAFCI